MLESSTAGYMKGLGKKVIEPNLEKPLSSFLCVLIVMEIFVPSFSGFLRIPNFTHTNKNRFKNNKTPKAKRKPLPPQHTYPILLFFFV